MISIENNNIYYNTEHLKLPKPKTFKEVIARLDQVDCKLFYNIISSPECRYEKKFAEGRIQPHYQFKTAEERFQNIFSEMILYANPKSFFVNKLCVLPKDCDAIKSVSFTHCNIEDLPKHFEARGSEFGICFFHEFLQNNGVRPVEYLNEKQDDFISRLVFNTPHLIEVFSSKYNMTWENEWRVKNNLRFTQDDIAFVIVPDDKRTFYLDWFEEQDLDFIKILSADIFKDPLNHLINYPQQDDNNWRQVRILSGPNDNGIKVSPSDFNDMLPHKKKEFGVEYKSQLLRFSKCVIMDTYERAFTSKYLRFVSKIEKSNNVASLLVEYERISENSSEPEDAMRDLIIDLFGELFSFYAPEWVKDLEN
ncbi:hypothetical protein ACQKCH_03900 [Nubsella zeaxanthinifaciens]|uniref:hypothetical protein n=1 Tax=Nubsella zeaxanthinifaciens TaxID=392412 RepID=UPI003D0158FF